MSKSRKNNVFFACKNLVIMMANVERNREQMDAVAMAIG